MTKVAIVTGASYGIGEHIARQLATKGWSVGLVARSLDKLQQIQAEIIQAGGVALAVSCDISQWDQVSDCVRRVESELGPVQVLINNAAYVTPLHQFVEGDPAEWQKMISVNVWGALNMTRTVLPGMLQRQAGKVIFMSSRAGISPTPTLAVHSGTKHLIEGVVGALRQEIAGKGVSLSIVRPGGVATPGYDHATAVSADDSTVPNWIPSSSANCLSPEVVARTVVNIVDIMDVADITDVNIAANKPIESKN